MKFSALVSVLFILLDLTLRAEQAPEGLLIVQEPSTTFTEAIEYRSFHQDNALFATLVTSKGENKKIKAAAVIAVVPYPPLSLDSSLEKMAEVNLQKITQLEARYPRVHSQLASARSRWERERAVFRQNKAEPVASVGTTSSSDKTDSNLPNGAHLTHATANTVTVTHTTGVRTFRISSLTAAQVLALNETSRTIQLPLGIDRPSAGGARGSTAASGANDTTQKIETGGRSVVAYLANILEVPERTLSVWTFFVVLPALVLVLSVILILMSRRGAVKVLPPQRP